MHGSCQQLPSGEESVCSPSETIDDFASDGSSIVPSADSLSDGAESGDGIAGTEESADIRMKALTRCCMTGDEMRLKALLSSNKYNINWQDRSGRTPLSYAASSGQDSIISLLQGNSQVNPNLADNDGNTPLIYSAAMGHDMATLWLLKFSQINVDQRNHSGFTALMKASIQDHVVCVKQLLSAGASMHLRDGSRGLTAIEWAKFCGSQESYLMLEIAAAEAPSPPQPDACDGGFKRSAAGSFRSRARPNSVRIRRPAAQGGEPLADSMTKAQHKSGAAGSSSAGARLASFIRRIKLALRFSHRNLKDGGVADSTTNATMATTAAAQAASVPSMAGTQQQRGDSPAKVGHREDAANAGNGSSQSGGGGSSSSNSGGGTGGSVARNPKLADALMKARARSLLPKIKVTKAPEDVLELDGDWPPASEVEVAHAALKSGPPRRRDCAGA